MSITPRYVKEKLKKLEGRATLPYWVEEALLQFAGGSPHRTKHRSRRAQLRRLSQVICLDRKKIAAHHQIIQECQQEITDLRHTEKQLRSQCALLERRLREWTARAAVRDDGK